MKKFLMGLIVGIGIMIPVTALGSTHIAAVLQPNVNVEIDGQLVELESAPINYDGRIYLQLREIGENVMGMEVDWEGETSTAVLTTPDHNPSTPPEPQKNEGDPVLETKPIDFSEYGYDEFYAIDETLEYYEVAQLIERLENRIDTHETYIDASKNPKTNTNFDPIIVQAFQDELDKMNKVLPNWKDLLERKIEESGVYDDIIKQEPIESTGTE